ncbi:hypothetical protein Echvi_2679 [Echinicola vietnamensis DSM 17526]|uniref:Uncharacterized protein n=1 Tax=Echinicola vietnamensis (strain DSM 17526 / LMG 23754 / KMM 6221) TaxID=926556 RepID=L0FYC5_ECHVK|nr:hypothetical protein Echvi_2679 [Echinicola vietnamensis DSM 17526]
MLFSLIDKETSPIQCMLAKKTKKETSLAF